MALAEEPDLKNTSAEVSVDTFVAPSNESVPCNMADKHHNDVTYQSRSFEAGSGGQTPRTGLLHRRNRLALQRSPRAIEDYDTTIAPMTLDTNIGAHGHHGNHNHHGNHGDLGVEEIQNDTPTNDKPMSNHGDNTISQHQQQQPQRQQPKQQQQQQISKITNIVVSENVVHALSTFTNASTDIECLDAVHHKLGPPEHGAMTSFNVTKNQHGEATMESNNFGKGSACVLQLPVDFLGWIDQSYAQFYLLLCVWGTALALVADIPPETVVPVIILISLLSFTPIVHVLMWLMKDKDR